MFRKIMFYTAIILPIAFSSFSFGCNSKALLKLVTKQSLLKSVNKNLKKIEVQGELVCCLCNNRPKDPVRFCESNFVACTKCLRCFESKQPINSSNRLFVLKTSIV